MMNSKLREQDESLDRLESSVARLGQLSLTISTEIDVQNRMLERLEIDAGRCFCSLYFIFGIFQRYHMR